MMGCCVHYTTRGITFKKSVADQKVACVNGIYLLFPCCTYDSVFDKPFTETHESGSVEFSNKTTVYGGFQYK
ncbi:hypothetical protein Hanom_Chr11g01009931 [Helianthus anomalus]